MFSFCKMQIDNNDFILINNLKNEIEYSYKLLSRFICDRHYGIGANSLLIIEESKRADLKIKMFNNDGEAIAITEDGIICLIQYIYEENLINKKEFYIEVLTGIKKVKLEGNEKIMMKIDGDSENIVNIIKDSVNKGTLGKDAEKVFWGEYRN